MALILAASFLPFLYGQMSSGTINGDVWVWLWEYAPWVASLFYSQHLVMLRMWSAIVGSVAMLIALSALALELSGVGTSETFSRVRMLCTLAVGAVYSAPYVGLAVIAEWGINVVQLRLNPLRFQHLEWDHALLWLPLAWFGALALGLWMARRLVARRVERKPLLPRAGR